jgi:hypothetical protein
MLHIRMLPRCPISHVEQQLIHFRNCSASVLQKSADIQIDIRQLILEFRVYYGYPFVQTCQKCNKGQRNIIASYQMNPKNSWFETRAISQLDSLLNHWKEYGKPCQLPHFTENVKIIILKIEMLIPIANSYVIVKVK